MAAEAVGEGVGGRPGGRQWREPHLALLLAGVVGRKQALNMQTVAVFLIAPQPLVGLGCPSALALTGTPAGRGQFGHRAGLRIPG